MMDVSSKYASRAFEFYFVYIPGEGHGKVIWEDILNTLKPTAYALH